MNNIEGETLHCLEIQPPLNDVSPTVHKGGYLEINLRYLLIKESLLSSWSQRCILEHHHKFLIVQTYPISNDSKWMRDQLGCLSQGRLGHILQKADPAE